MLMQPRFCVRTNPRVVHGALDFEEMARLGLSPGDVLDFSVNSNPYGPSPRVREAVAGVPLDRYPDRESLALRQALASRLGVSPQAIVVGNGASELLLLLALAYVRSGDTIFIVEPTFGEYARVVRLMGGLVHPWWAKAEDDFAVDVVLVAEAVHDLRPRVAFLCNPNNPTGQYLSLQELRSLVEAAPQTLFVIDEAYLPFVASGRSALELQAANVLVLRSMTKEYALAGLRLGYAVGPTEVIAALAAVRPAWNVNAMAQAAGVAALEDETYLQRSLTWLAQANADFRANLTGLGLIPLPSATHFFLLQVGNGARFRQTLLRQGILVRDGASFGLPAYVRIATRRPEENQQLIQALGGN